MFTLPKAAEPVLLVLSVAFSRRLWPRVLLLLMGLILSSGRRSVSALLSWLRPFRRGHYSSYARVFCRSSWSLWRLGKFLTELVVELVPADQPIVVPVDDTVCQHKGKKVYGKGCHRDPVRSTHSHTVFRWGHKWVVLAIAVPLAPFLGPWALPVLATLYRPEQLDHDERRRHKTPPQLARQLMAVLIHWFPQRRFILVGDGNYATHELARFCRRHRRHVTLVSRFYADAALYEPPPDYGGNGRPRVKGDKLPMPQEVVAGTTPCKARVPWYGGKDRLVGLVSGQGQWYQSGCGLVPVRWLYVEDWQGTHRPEYFFSTDPSLSPKKLIGYYTKRWTIEVTFEEMRAHLGLETTREWCRRSVLRLAPCLFGLFSVVSLIWHQQVQQAGCRVRSQPWYRKQQPTFSDALAEVRRLFWEETIFASLGGQAGLQKVTPELREILLEGLCYAA